MVKRYLSLLWLLFITATSIGFPSTEIVFEKSTGVKAIVNASDPLPITLSNSASVSFSIVNGSGILGTATLSIPLASAVALPTAPTGAVDCFIMPTQDANWGATTVASGTGHQYFFADIPGQGIFDCSDFTSFRLIGRTAVGTATIIWR